MARYIYYNPNPAHSRVGDCTVRALSRALGRDWETIYVGLALQGFAMGDMPSANVVWGSYLRSNGFIRRLCPDCGTVGDLADAHPAGTYILALQNHVVCVEGGNIYDSWDSRDETPLYYWERMK